MKEVKHDNKWEDPAEEDALDPLSPEFAPGLSLIVLMRIYEVQLAMLRTMAPEFAAKLLEQHSRGEINTPMPWLDPDSLKED